MRPVLIYCADGNPRFAKIAIDAGFEYGAQPTEKTYYPLYFADQNWKNPDREAYMKALEKHRPHMATVLDWEKEEQLPEVLSWAEEASQYVEKVLIVPKVIGGIARLPRRINDTDVWLAYSVPTKYGGTFVPTWEFDGWPVHLLGGSPHRQIEFAHYLNVCSTDSNYAQKSAIMYNVFWLKPGKWKSLAEADGKKWEHDAPYEAFRRSCENIIEVWDELYG